MHSRVVTREAQGLNDVDTARMGEFPQDGARRLVRDFLSGSAIYQEFLTTPVPNDSVNVQIATGSIYTAGGQYISDKVEVRSVAAYLPQEVSKSVKVLVVGQGLEVPTALEERYYERVIDPSNPASPLQQTVEDDYRVIAGRAFLSLVPGVAAARPVSPVAPAGSVPIAEILVTSSGIQSVTMVRTARIVRLEEVAAEVVSLRAENDRMRQSIEGIRVDLATVAASGSSNFTDSFVQSLAVDMAEVRKQLALPSDGSPYTLDNFLDYVGTDYNPDTDVAGSLDFDARIDEGIRFGYAAKSDAPIALLNANDPNLALVSAGLICPAFNEVSGLSILDATGDMPLGGVSVQVVKVEHLVESREKIVYGESKTVSNSSKYWRDGGHDSIKGIFRDAAGNLFKAALPFGNSVAGTTSGLIRLKQFWKTTIEVPYDKFSVTESTMSGVVKCETFMQSQERWITSTRLAIKRWGDGAEITAVLCECDNSGRPDPTRALSSVKLTSASFKAWPEMTTFKMAKPILSYPLVGDNGRARPYAILWCTTGDVDVMTASGASYLGGTLLTTTDMQSFDPDVTRDICFEVMYAEFKATTMPIRLQPFSLQGGIETIDILASVLVPGAASATFEVFVGNEWRALDASEAGASFLSGNQVLYDARVMLTGTAYAMPIINTANSNVRCSRPKQHFDWIGKPWTIGSSAAQIKVRVLAGAYDPARHTLALTARYGASFASVKAASGAPVVRTVPGREVGRLDQETGTYLEWTLDFSGAPVGAVKFELIGDTNNFRIPFHVEQLVGRKAA